MISRQAVEDQLKRIGANFRFWGRSEINELGRILMEDEIIAECVNGEYSNGFAMLVATNHRLLLVDKKPLLYLTVEDYRYEMITEFNLNHRMLSAAINIHTANKTMSFTSWSQHRLRRLLEYVQARVLEMRQHQQLASQFSAAAATQFAQAYAAQTAAHLQGQAIPAPPAFPALTPSPAPASQQARAVPAPAPVPALPLPADASSATASPPAAGAAERPASSRPPAGGERHSRLADLASAASKLSSSGRAVLGTYTRNKLPSFRRPSLPGAAAGQTAAGTDRPNPAAETGEVLPEGYRPMPGIGRFGIRYDFES